LAAALFAETLEDPRQMTRLTPETRGDVLDTGRGNFITR